MYLSRCTPNQADRCIGRHNSPSGCTCRGPHQIKPTDAPGDTIVQADALVEARTKSGRPMHRETRRQPDVYQDLWQADSMCLSQYTDKTTHINFYDEPTSIFTIKVQPTILLHSASVMWLSQIPVVARASTFSVRINAMDWPGVISCFGPHSNRTLGS
jgi:hypothetical protein